MFNLFEIFEKYLKIRQIKKIKKMIKKKRNLSYKLWNALKNNVLISYWIPGTDQFPWLFSLPKNLIYRQ